MPTAMPPVVVLDACVLYPAAQRDIFMWLAAGGAIRAHWTNEIHDEWMRNVEQGYSVARSILERVRKLEPQGFRSQGTGEGRSGGRNSRCFLVPSASRLTGKCCCGVHTNARQPPKSTQDDEGVRRHARRTRLEEVREVDIRKG